jgi:transcriptional regulator with XRE-family HTH domain
MKARALVARNLRRLRVKKGLSQEALAVDAGIDRTYVSRLERGLENPTVAVLERLSQALDAEIVQFFVVPKPGDPAPKPLPGGRRRRF